MPVYQAGEVSGLEIDLVYHCVQKKALNVAWVDTDKRLYCTVDTVVQNEVHTAHQMLLRGRVIFIDPPPAMPLPDVSKLLPKRAVKKFGGRP